MFNDLSPQPVDKIMNLMIEYAGDQRPDKIDLGVGVYKDAQGITPVMRAVKTAEQKIWQEQQTKTYLGLAGDVGFHDVMTDLVLGGAVPRNHVAAIGTPGGTGALRQGFELIHNTNTGARVFASDPTWPNHLGILSYLGLETVPYRYFDSESRGVDFAGMIQDLDRLGAGDVILLHGCCHNPSGANLTLPEWRQVVDRINAVGALPMIDLAYQGFGDGLEQDAAATRLIASSVPECLIAASCSKNFGIYRERTGVLLAVTAETASMPLLQENLTGLNRMSYSFPPDHGARVVTTILGDAELRADWRAELEGLRLGMLGLREQLASELQRLTGSDRYGFLAQHRGMFSLLGIGPEMVEALKVRHGIYMIPDSRMNIAGLNPDTVPILARAIVEVGG